ncbi:hypothetical protein BDW68DRAFT_186447 [Aspergillus falconensis]
MPREVTAIPYDHGIYHTATSPILRDAIAAFNARNAQQAINTVIRDCFPRHKVETQFSVSIIHRHFDLEPGERNIEEIGRASASRDLDDISPATGFSTMASCSRLCGILGIQLYTDGIVGFESTDHEASKTGDELAASYAFFQT